MNRNNIKLGALYMLISVTGFSIMDIAVKWTTAEYSIGMVIAARMIGGLIPLFLVVPKERWGNFFHTTKPGLMFIRAFTGTAALFLSLIHISEPTRPY